MRPATSTTPGAMHGRSSASVADWTVVARRAVATWLRDPATRSVRARLRGVDNNAYVNMAAAESLRQAAACAVSLGEDVPPAWNEIADGMVLPLDSRRGAIVNHDGARLDEEQGGVPEGAAGLFPVGYRLAGAAERATYRYAFAEQGPRYVGAPMLSALLPVYAARGGTPRPPANSSSVATVSSSTSRSSNPTSSLARGPIGLVLRRCSRTSVASSPACSMASPGYRSGPVIRRPGAVGRSPSRRDGEGSRSNASGSAAGPGASRPVAETRPRRWSLLSEAAGRPGRSGIALQRCCRFVGGVTALREVRAARASP